MIFVFSFIKEFHIELIAYFHEYVFHITLIHSLYLIFSHDFIFMSMICAYRLLSVWRSCDSHVFHEISSCFIPYLKDFVLVFKIVIKLVAVFSLLVEFSNMLNLFSNLFLKTPTHLRVVGSATMPCMHYWKSI